jgi:hypothetical protein
VGDEFRKLDQLRAQKLQAFARGAQTGARVGPQAPDFRGGSALERRLRRLGETAMLS